MQIHELDTFQGTPSDSTYLAIDDGTETNKIPASEVGVSTEMTLAEAQAGTVEDPRVISPMVLKEALKTLHPVGSVFSTSANTNPSSLLGFGTWELIDKRFRYQWITSGFTWNSSNTQSGSFAVCIHGNTIEFRFVWANKLALTDDTTEIGTLNLSAIGLSSAQHNMYGVAACDGLNSIGCLEFALGSSTAVLRSSDWVSRSATLPTGTGSNCQATFTMVVQNHTGMIDSFCNEFVWQRTS